MTVKWSKLNASTSCNLYHISTMIPEQDDSYSNNYKESI